MQIKKLTMEGFGRYVDKQTLDFEENLSDRNIFVVTGKTGAGKTTIFDAINFALYGDASGSSRDGKSLRSDHANNNTPTEVQLWFSIRDKTYTILRRPQYVKSKARGEGTTISKPYAEIILPDGKVETGYQTVTERVEEILGITETQFKQLVMIPQGEFKKLLEAPSNQKESIFRKIFGTESFERIQQKLKNEANELKQSVSEVISIREKRIRGFEAGENEELNILINAENININEVIDKFKETIQSDNISLQEIEKQVAQINTEIEKLNNKLTLCEANNKKIMDLEKVEEYLNQLVLQESTIKIQKDRVSKAQKAATVSNLEAQFQFANKRLKVLGEEVETLSLDRKEKEKTYLDAKDVYEKQLKNEEIKIKYNTDINTLKSLIQKVSEYEKVVSELNGLKLNESKIKTQIGATKEKLEKDKIEIVKFEKELEKILEFKDKLAKLTINLSDIERLEDDIISLQNNINQRTDYKTEHKQKEDKYEKLNKEYKAIKQDYEDKEEAFKRNQAGILAKDLVDNTPCPVCGSINHPSLALIDETDISEKVVEEAKVKYLASMEANELALSNVKKYNDLINHMDSQIIKPIALKILGTQDESIDDIQKKVVEKIDIVSKQKIKLSEEIAQISRIVELEDYNKKQIEGLKLDIEANTATKENKDAELRNIEIQIKGIESNKEIISKEFEGEIKTTKQLNDEIADKADKLQKLQEALETSKDIYDVANNNLSAVNANLLSKEKDKKLVAKEREESLEVFQNKVIELGFENGREYTSSKLNEEEIDKLMSEIKTYEDKLLTNKNDKDRLIKETENLKITNLDDLKNSIATLKDTKTQIDIQDKNLYSKISNNKNVLQDTISYSSKIESKENEYSMIGSLALEVNGDNPRKMSLERYVLAAYFEDIILAANLRLGDMTGNQYELFRKEEIGDARMQQGLDLEVLDNYTGKKRSVTTLSGGEGFKASLALALGLADVVQSYAGGIQLDTMFIDEGFGTLDPESLDAAIDCLVDLQNDGRVVGIISHVEELKERIPAHLHVTATQNGSKAVFRV